MSYRYEHTYCSQCGRDVGPGDSGLSHCQDHNRACPRCTYRGREQRCPRDGERTIRGEIADAVDSALTGVRRAA